jgi:nucleotide-binding universal stress UspA family protein
LKRNIKAKRVNIKIKHDKTGEILLTHAKENKFDLIVMGAYGHSRLSEIILGGTTQYMMNNSQIPLLMSH